MTIDELPIEEQNRLRETKPAFVGRRINSVREVLAYDKTGTRYFHAWREYRGSRYGNYGNPSEWRIRYGKVQFCSEKDPFGDIYYEWCNGKTFGKSPNGTVIPSFVGTKKEVMDVLNKIGIFDINETN